MDMRIFMSTLLVTKVETSPPSFLNEPFPQRYLISGLRKIKSPFDRRTYYPPPPARHREKCRSHPSICDLTTSPAPGLNFGSSSTKDLRKNDLKHPAPIYSFSSFKPSPLLSLLNSPA